MQERKQQLKDAAFNREAAQIRRMRIDDVKLLMKL